MSYPSYISQNIEELIDRAPDHILDIIESDDIPNVTITLGNNYKIPVGDQASLSDIITFTIIGALQTEDVVQALQDMAHVSYDDAVNIATDLEFSLFEKARVTLLKKEGEIKTLEFNGQRSKEELRKEIMDTTKRESGLHKNQSTVAPKKPSIIAPGSRSQLMEQLQVIGNIPDDEEINERLQHIHEQIAALKKQEDDNSLESTVALKSFMFGEKGKEMVTPSLRPATYSVAPKEYNVDPYREITEES
ncbi:MAG: hypothetical protein RLZZ308_96 [Candidatus Parcubacteria bacterium]|jgi:hypothetical protein